MELRRGDVVVVNLDLGSENNIIGSEQGGEQRPCLIVSNDMGNKYSPVVTIVPLTSRLMKKNLPTHLFLTKDQYPIIRDSIALCEQVRTVDKSRISGNVLFKLNQLEMKKLDKCMVIAMGVDVSALQQERKVI